jgi:hypothetical protein
MANIQEQLIQEHASLIVEVVEACDDEAKTAQLLENLVVAEQNGWGKLCGAIRMILDGAREREELGDMDVEDEAIAQAMLMGIADPATLPQPDGNANPMLAPEGLAGIIASAATGEENALQMLARMDTDLAESPIPELQQFGQTLRRLLNGERNADSLTLGLDERTASLIIAVLDELNKLGV